MKKGDLSKFIEEAVRWRVFHRTVQDIKARNAKANRGVAAHRWRSRPRGPHETPHQEKGLIAPNAGGARYEHSDLRFDLLGRQALYCRLVNQIKRLAEDVSPLPRVKRSPDPKDNFLLPHV
jgi:hypothetical protein